MHDGSCFLITTSLKDDDRHILHFELLLHAYNSFSVCCHNCVS